MVDLPHPYTFSRATSQDIAAMIMTDRAAATLFEPTGLLSQEADLETVPHSVFTTALAGAYVNTVRDHNGTAIGFTLTSERGGSLYLDQVSVHPDHGQNGIGRALVIGVIKDAEHRGLPSVTLSTFRDLPWNGPFYASMGFKEIPRDKLEPYMREIEEAQKPLMDVSARCFMRRKVRRPLFRFKRTA